MDADGSSPTRSAVLQHPHTNGSSNGLPPANGSAQLLSAEHNGGRVSTAGRGATFRNQANALLRKNGVYQRRNWCSNICLLSAPILFCLVLFALQMVVNKLLLTGEDFEVSGSWGGGGVQVCGWRSIEAGWRVRGVGGEGAWGVPGV